MKRRFWIDWTRSFSQPPLQRIPICAATGGAQDMQTCFAAFVSLKIGKIAAIFRRHANVSTVPE
jgi:hypothetical protein